MVFFVGRIYLSPSIQKYEIGINLNQVLLSAHLTYGLCDAALTAMEPDNRARKAKQSERIKIRKFHIFRFVHTSNDDSDAFNNGLTLRPIWCCGFVESSMVHRDHNHTLIVVFFGR